MLDDHGWSWYRDRSLSLFFTGSQGQWRYRKKLAFFGEQHAASDFLYQEELQAFQQEGILHRLDTAFSRDQEQKIYVQHRLLAQASEIFSWLQAGAFFYVCGDAARMAKDVEAALLEIIATQGNYSPEEAANYLQSMKKEKRYRKDVY